MMEVTKIGERRIVIKGIGEMYYQEGFPVEMSVLFLKDKGIEVSYLHIADELLKNGFPAKRVRAILNADGISDADKFCGASYEEQREMIFDYLFGSQETAKKWFNEVWK